MLVALLCCCLLITAGTDGQQAGNVEIENCSAGVIDIREIANNTIQCTGFNKSDIIVWTLKRTDWEIPRTVATCVPSSNCTVHQPDHFAVERSPSHSTLFYQQYDREVDKAATITCHSQFEGSLRSMLCTLNVINPAELSNCTVEEDRGSGTVTGRCRFDHAYSFFRAFTCTWYQEKDGQSKRLSCDITYDSLPQSPGGVCTFTSTDLDSDPGTYTYSILFYPGPGNITVNVGNTDTSPKTQEEVEENDLPVGAIVGGIVAVVAVIIVIIVVVVVVVFIRRKRRQKPAGSAKASSNDASNENDDCEEHVNPMYVTSQDPDNTHTTDHNHSTIALQISPNSHNGHPAAPHSLEADMYTTVDDEARYVPSSEADRSGGYEDIGFGSNGNTRVPQKDEYAVVDKSRAKKGPASSANTRASSPAHTTEGSDEYAVVDNSSSRNKATNVASGLSDAATSNAGVDVYAQVNKSAKKVKVADPETEGAAYAQVQKPKPAVKPKGCVSEYTEKKLTTTIVVHHLELPADEKKEERQKAAAVQRQRVSLMERAAEHRQRRLNGQHGKVVTSMAKAVATAAAKDKTLAQHIVNVCSNTFPSSSPQPTKAPVSPAVKTPTVIEVVTSFLKRSARSKRELYEVAEYSLVLLKDLPDSLHRRRALRISEDLGAFCTFAQSIFEAWGASPSGQGQEGVKAVMRLAEIQGWINSALASHVATVRKLRGSGLDKQ